MATFPEWLDVQDGADLRGREQAYLGFRHWATPRDLEAVQADDGAPRNWIALTQGPV